MRSAYMALWALFSSLERVIGKSLEISAPEKASLGISKPVEHDFASFSFPVHFFADYAGNKSSPNLFSRDIIELLYAKTGSHPQIRVGGTSADRAIYNASQQESIVLSTAQSNGIPLEVSLGPVFFEGFESFPGTPWTFQVNLANNKSNALENALAEARVALSHIKGDLVAFEIGNEPDLYPGDVRPLNYTVADYVREWNYFADAISDQVLRGNEYGLEDRRLFQALTFVFIEFGFTVQKAFDDGIASTGHVKSVSRHQYATGNQAWVRLQDSFMNHTAVTNNLTQYVPEMELMHSYDPNITFLLGETNSDYVNLNMIQVEGVFGSSIWLVDYLLYGMSLNISRVNLIQGTTFGYAAWVPVEYDGQAPHVRPPLYGQIVAADVIGHHSDVQIQSLDLGRWDISAYAVYESQVLSKYVVINLNEWNTTTAYPRPEEHIKLAAPGNVHKAEITRLKGMGASSVTDITWGGYSWNRTSEGRLGRSGKHDVEKALSEDGYFRVSLPATEVVLLELENNH